jgi:hypothetical protein
MKYCICFNVSLMKLYVIDGHNLLFSLLLKLLTSNSLQIIRSWIKFRPYRSQDGLLHLNHLIYFDIV